MIDVVVALDLRILEEVACEHSTLTITCTGGNVIRMLFANFGRIDGLGIMTKTNDVRFNYLFNLHMWGGCKTCYLIKLMVSTTDTDRQTVLILRKLDTFF